MGSTDASKKWLITGASQGLGLSMALSALKAGHKVIATARNMTKAKSEHPELEGAGGTWLELDVTSHDTQAIVSKAIEEAGGVDVVVNNAGIFLPGNIEDINEEEMQMAMSANFYGPIRVLKAALPTLRAQRSGTIIYNSSIFGFYPCPGGTMYNTTKAAGDMLYDTLKAELSSFNIRVITLNAGLFKTNVLVNSVQPTAGFNKQYLQESTIGGVLGLVGQFAQDPDTNIPGDPAKFGDRVVEMVDGTGLGKALQETTHVFMGRDGLSLAKKHLAALQADLEASQEVGASTDFEGHTALGVALVAGL